MSADQPAVIPSPHQEEAAAAGAEGRCSTGRGSPRSSSTCTPGSSEPWTLADRDQPVLSGITRDCFMLIL